MYARADEEPVDPKRELEDRCKAPCTRPLKEYQVIVIFVDRISSLDELSTLPNMLLSYALMFGYVMVKSCNISVQDHR